MKALMEEAARLGVSVHLAHLGPELLGCYIHKERQIYLNLTATQDERYETLGHELGHAYNGDEHGQNEAAADRRAALLLVDPDLYEHAERENPHPRAIGERLGLTEHLVTIWRDWWLPQIVNRRNRRA